MTTHCHLRRCRFCSRRWRRRCHRWRRGCLSPLAQSRALFFSRVREFAVLLILTKPFVFPVAAHGDILGAGRHALYWRRDHGGLKAEDHLWRLEQRRDREQRLCTIRLRSNTLQPTRDAMQRDRELLLGGLKPAIVQRRTYISKRGAAVTVALETIGIGESTKLVCETCRTGMDASPVETAIKDCVVGVYINAYERVFDCEWHEGQRTRSSRRARIKRAAFHFCAGPCQLFREMRRASPSTLVMDVSICMFLWLCNLKAYESIFDFHFDISAAVDRPLRKRK